MAFQDLLHRLADNSNPLIARAVELREGLSDDPNDIASFEELAGIIRTLGAERPVADPLTAESANEEISADLILWSLAEDLASDSRAWYPQLQLAKLSVDNDIEAAVRHLENAADREEHGLALAAGIKILRDAGQADAAQQLGLGRWNVETNDIAVTEQLIGAALDAGKPNEAERYVEFYGQSNNAANDDVIRLRALITEE